VDVAGAAIEEQIVWRIFCFTIINECTK